MTLRDDDLPSSFHAADMQSLEVNMYLHIPLL
jgi:hypothetical protein